ncbi:MAG: NAD(P)/FAD-dependent oxidoreductase [Solirubrobacterales bacterium]
MRDNRARIAIVGTGIAGLTAAHMLHREHELTVFEAADRIGGHTNTVRVDDPSGALWVDTGFIVHNDRNYPRFTRLLEELGVRTQPSAMGMSIASGDGRFEFANTKHGLFAQRSNLLRPRFWRLVADQLRFNREVRPLAGRRDAPTVGEFLRDSGYSRWFIERAIAPEVSAVWSADPGAVWDFPLGFLAEFLDNHGQLQLTDRPRWRTIDGGSRTYVERLVAPFRDRIRLGAPVRRIERLGDAVEVEADGCETEVFDQVVVAAHSDQALAMLAHPSDAERAVLGAIRYQRNHAVLHTDSSVMPRRRRAWAGWNFHLGGAEAGGTAVTYWMNNLQRLDAERDYFVTLNRSDRIDPGEVIETIEYSHPQITHTSVAAQRRWEQISGRDRVHYCGAYWRWGFHEDGCWSAIRACESLLASEPASPRPVELELAA